MSNRGPSFNASSRSSRTSSPASGQPRIASGATGSRPTTPGPGGQPRGGSGSGTASRPTTPGPGGQQRRGAAPTSRPTTPGRGAGGGNNAGLASHFSSPSASSPSSGTGSPSPPRKITTLTTTVTAKPTATDNADHLGGLCITLESDTASGMDPATNLPSFMKTTVADGSPLFLSVAAATNLGLKLLESARGKDALIRLGVKAVNGWTADRKKHIFPESPATHVNMAPSVTAYLRELRAKFVPVSLTNHINGEGSAEKFDWAQPTAGRPTKGLADYVASKAGVLRLNKFIFETIVEASKQIQNGKPAYERTYEIQMALMGITVAPELCHFFIGFLVGYRRPQTPPDIIYLPKDHKTIEGDPTGKSGRWWEAEVFGGETRPFTESLADLNAPDKHPLSYRQAGDLWLMNANSTRISVIDRKSITGILEFDFSPSILPLRLVGPDHNVMDVKRTRLYLHQMRNLALGKTLDFVPPKRALTKQELDAHNALRKRAYSGSEFERLGMILSNPKYLYKAVA